MARAQFSWTGLLVFVDLSIFSASVAVAALPQKTKDHQGLDRRLAPTFDSDLPIFNKS